MYMYLSDLASRVLHVFYIVMPYNVISFCFAQMSALVYMKI